MARRSFVLMALLGACSSTPMGGVPADGGPIADALDAGGPEATPLPPQCADAAVPPSTLECTGLYADLGTKALAAGVEAYTPAVPLWSDGAEKHRWISLPPGARIDTTNPSEWVFPVGTRFWKEFSAGGKRIETRLWQKVRSDYWVNAAYAWNADESAAKLSGGGDIPLGVGTYHIPTQDECEKCHRGRTEHILGFEQVELGLPGASGITLADLVSRGLLTSPPSATTLAIGDDGTGAAAPALGWLHANCGITCHNGNSNATAYPSGLRFRLDPTQLDGRSSKDFDALRTGVGVAVNAPNWKGQVRIVPGDPEASLLYFLISHRGQGMQMPPIATRLVDLANVALVGRWISLMPALPGGDAGPPDAGVDAEPDAMLVPPDAGADAAPDVALPPPDAGAPDLELDAGSADAAEPEAGPPDAAAEDAPADADVADTATAD
jgi:hypothetical protein